MKKKLIEVALPLEAINKESAREKTIRHGHPSTIHLWWARRPLATCRAVLFASLVDDPSSHPELFPTEAHQDRERQRLFRLIEELVKWDNSSNRSILEAAHQELLKSTGGNPPPVYDPFCGGGSIPLEAQRLGLVAHASDLNPVAVLITKALVEIPAKFMNRPPVNPTARKKLSAPGMWRGSRGLADDVRYYGQWMRDRAWERIGQFYPPAEMPKESGGGQGIVIAWLWARTVRCPNPACGADMPLVRSFALSTKSGTEAWVEPLVDHAARTIQFEVRKVPGKLEGTKQRNRSECLICGNVLTDASVREQAKTHGFGQVLMAVLADAGRGRVYVDAKNVPTPVLPNIETPWLEQPLPNNPRWFSPPGYGLPQFGDIFTARQRLALKTFSDLVLEARQQAIVDGADAERGDAIATYLAFAVDKAADRNSSLCGLERKMNRLTNTFSRQALPMVWDFAETNPFADASGDLRGTIESVCEVLDRLPCGTKGIVQQLDATTRMEIARNSVESSRPLVLIRYATAASLATDFFETALVIEDNSIGICR